MPQLSYSWSVSEFLIQTCEMFFCTAPWGMSRPLCPCLGSWSRYCSGRSDPALTGEHSRQVRWPEHVTLPTLCMVFFRYSPTLQYSFTLASSRWMFAMVKCFTLRSSLLRQSLSIIQCPGGSTILYNLSTINLRILRFLPCKNKRCDWKTGFDKMMCEIILCCKVW